MADLPRVLFLTPCAFNPITGTGVTFSNLFRGWPRARLATVTDDPVPVSRDVCDQYFFLTDQELRYQPPLHWLRRRTHSQQLPTGGSAGGAGRFPAWRRAAKKLLGAGGPPERACLSPRLAAWLDDYRPELVYSILGTTGYCDLLEAIARHCAAPFVLHVMDHGTIAPAWPGLFGWWARRGLERRLPRLMRGAAGCLAIGEAMAREYGRHYGRPFAHFQNTMDLTHHQPFVKRDLRCGTPARFVYVGSLHPYATAQALQDCAAAIAALRGNGLAVELTVYTPLELFGSQAAALGGQPGVVVRPAPTADAEFFRVLQAADALVLPVNFDEASVHFIRLSMPTKVPSYLASGVPILVYGPRGTAQVDYAAQHGWGHVIDVRAAAPLQAGMQAILADAGLRAALSCRARNVAAEFHDADVVRARFQQFLAAALPTAGTRRAA